MGCDIHLFTEKKKTINNQELWVNVDRFRMNPYFEQDGHKNEFEIVELYEDRNYILFSMLANVRNKDNNPIISQPKGMPDDCCDYVNKQKEYWGKDGHSHSYLTLKELKDFQEQHKVTKYSGMMTEQNAALVDKGEMPDSWCAWTNQKGYVYREWEYESDTLGVLVEKLEQRLKEEMYYSYDSDIESEYDNIRIVFWFYN